MRALLMSTLLLACACSAARPKPENPSVSAAEHRGLYAVFVTARGSVEARLFEDDAPKTVEEFATRARRGDFNGVPLERAVPGFLVQAAGGAAGAPLEFEGATGRGFRKAGRLAAPALDGGSVPGQFFVTLEPLPWLDGRNAVFGEVTAGLDHLLEAAGRPRLERDSSGRFVDRPHAPLTLEQVRIEERR